MTERKGRVMLHDPATGLNTVAAKLDVYQHDEEGVQSIAIDPNFKSNKWVYIYHSLPTGNTPVDDPATPAVNEGDAPFTGTPADFAKFKGDRAAVALQDARRQDRAVDRAADHRRDRRPRDVLPRRRSHRLRQPGQPVPVDG